MTLLGLSGGFAGEAGVAEPGVAGVAAAGVDGAAVGCCGVSEGFCSDELGLGPCRED